MDGVDYSGYPVRDQASNLPATLDLLQAWGPPLREPLRLRLGRALSRVVRRLRAAVTMPRCVPCGADEER